MSVNSVNFNLGFLGIYPEAISDAISTSESVLKENGFTDYEIDNMNDIALTTLKEVGSFDHLTNSIIFAYFDAVKFMLERKFGDDMDVDYYINCHDSHFYIDNEEQYPED